MKNAVSPEEELENQDGTGAEAAGSKSAEQGGHGTESAPGDSLKTLQAELAEAKEKYLRLYAEFDNHRRRTAKEKLEMIQSAGEGLIKVLLPVMDDFERAEKSFTEKNAKEAEGFFLIQNKFKKILEQNGVRPMDTATGADFNPDLQEAITKIPVEDKNLRGKVVDVVEKGYFLSDKVIRFAKVVIGH
jgi:molecular chaperone GrpE